MKVLLVIFLVETWLATSFATRKRYLVRPETWQATSLPKSLLAPTCPYQQQAADNQQCERNAGKNQMRVQRINHHQDANDQVYQPHRAHGVTLLRNIVPPRPRRNQRCVHRFELEPGLVGIGRERRLRGLEPI